MLTLCCNEFIFIFVALWDTKQNLFKRMRENYYDVLQVSQMAF